ncbi:hypothetical protein SAPIO_CDS1252 [Scedosporium apiospermum]|uniref:Uncharacterized protein n=1 Tax=Pseudallescheria apiosperma TaxID=563466 RepID=A0A084GEX1_PSEDA|nr:uncharacterized protein SAPIO_CDS1252 [Scedosporium apiospermum]KEZ45883.1 hypothetical protein SAPIO_CDS1252 [Scedosporium apiospermum]
MDETDESIPFIADVTSHESGWASLLPRQSGARRPAAHLRGTLFLLFLTSAITFAFTSLLWAAVVIPAVRSPPKGGDNSSITENTHQPVTATPSKSPNSFSAAAIEEYQKDGTWFGFADEAKMQQRLTI